jgi:hypothetical protein
MFERNHQDPGRENKWSSSSSGTCLPLKLFIVIITTIKITIHLFKRFSRFKLNEIRNLSRKRNIMKWLVHSTYMLLICYNINNLVIVLYCNQNILWKISKQVSCLGKSK